MFVYLHLMLCTLKISKKKVACLTFRAFYAYKVHLSGRSLIYAFYAHKEHLKKVASLTFCAFYPHKKHLSESRLFILFMLIKNI